MTFARWITRARFLSPRRRLELYPPFFLMRVRVLELTDDWRHVRLRLPLHWASRNPGGSMYGGHQASVADPIAALACARRFPGYDVWTRHLAVDFRLPGDSDLELRFDFDPAQEAAIATDLAAHGRADAEFRYGLYRDDGRCCTRVRNTVALRPQGYRVGAPAGP